jgi:hypothetical protein
MIEPPLQIPRSSELPQADGLPAVLELAVRYPQFLIHIGQLLRVDIVVDVNVIAGLLIGKVRFPQQKHRLEELVGSGLVRLHIPSWGIVELTTSCRSYEGCSPGAGLRDWCCDTPTSSPESPG